MEAFRDCKNKLENKKEKDKPVALLKKAINALSEVDLESLPSANNKDELINKASIIQSLMQEIVSSLTRI